MNDTKPNPVNSAAIAMGGRGTRTHAVKQGKRKTKGKKDERRHERRTRQRDVLERPSERAAGAHFSASSKMADGSRQALAAAFHR